MTSMAIAFSNAGITPAMMAAPAQGGGVSFPATSEKKTFSYEQLVSFLRMVIKPSDLMRKHINAFLKDRTDRRYLVFAAERSLASFTVDNPEAVIGQTERSEDDPARCYIAYDLRLVNKVVYRNSAGKTLTFTRVSDDTFERVETQA